MLAAAAYLAPPSSRSRDPTAALSTTLADRAANDRRPPGPAVAGVPAAPYPIVRPRHDVLDSTGDLLFDRSSIASESSPSASLRSPAPLRQEWRSLSNPKAADHRSAA